MLRDGLAPRNKAEVEATTAEERQKWWRRSGQSQLRQLLYWRWDPIGVNDAFPSNHDEYDGYADAMRDLMVGEADEDVLEADVFRAVLSAQEAMGFERKPKAEEDRRRVTEMISPISASMSSRHSRSNSSLGASLRSMAFHQSSLPQFGIPRGP
jgi:hypothetical protein